MPDDEDRRAILSRRNRLVAIALSGLASAGTGCYESHGVGALPPGRDSGVLVDSGPTVCLSVDGGFDSGTPPTPCLGAPLDGGFDSGTTPIPCLGVALDGGFDGAIPAPCLSMLGDAGPTACLDIDLRDAGPEAGVVPTPCLTAMEG